MIEGIYIVIALAVTLFIAALAMKEKIIAMFSSFLFLLAGLSIVTNNGLVDVPAPYYSWVGIILILLGAFVIIKAGLELIGVDA